jgi:hypothetical protein
MVQDANLSQYPECRNVSLQAFDLDRSIESGNQGDRKGDSLSWLMPVTASKNTTKSGGSIVLVVWWKYMTPV